MKIDKDLVEMLSVLFLPFFFTKGKVTWNKYCSNGYLCAQFVFHLSVNA